MLTKLTKRNFKNQNKLSSNNQTNKYSKILKFRYYKKEKLISFAMLLLSVDFLLIFIWPMKYARKEVFSFLKLRIILTWIGMRIIELIIGSGQDVKE